jgi:hypothetical protein
MSNVLQIIELLQREHTVKLLVPKDVDKVRAESVPAMRSQTSGQLYVGKRGKTHADIINSSPELKKHWETHEDPYETHQRGFYHHKEKTFYDDDDGLLDSAEMMTPHQRFKTFGSESQRQVQKLHKQNQGNF